MDASYHGTGKKDSGLKTSMPWQFSLVKSLGFKCFSVGESCENKYNIILQCFLSRHILQDPCGGFYKG